MRAYEFIAAALVALLVLPMAAHSQDKFTFDPKKGDIEAEGPGKKPNKLPVGRAVEETTTGMVQVSSSLTRILRCDGTFYGKAKVTHTPKIRRKEFHGSSRQFKVAVPPKKLTPNIRSFKIHPKRFTLAADGVQFIEFLGGLGNVCKKGYTAIIITWPGPTKKGRSTTARMVGPINVSPLTIFTSMSYKRSTFVSWALKEKWASFNHDAVLWCCPGTRGHYRVIIDSKSNIKDVRVKYDSFSCPTRRGGPISVNFSGHLKEIDELGTIDFKVNRSGGGSCLDRIVVKPQPKR